ncbi:sigma 54-interacting transcriptional regulator [Mucilaginibacter sp.]|uniref:sigma-54-dependent Fis family transcriptional regulator n=1 Tax=Mucilaginibacter sp. TaxID=1882438 RepID=UPI00356247CD
MQKNQSVQLHADLDDDLFVSKILLSISNDLASTRTKDDLLDVLLERLKALVPFDDILITIYIKDKHSHYVWAHRYHSLRRIHPAFDEYIVAEYPAEDGILDVIQNNREPVVFDIDKVVESGQAPEYIKYYQENGLAQLVGVMMRSTEAEVGGFFLTSTNQDNFEEGHLAIIKGISSQLCIAASNVLANEAILKHEQEKSILLSLSNAIASVRTKQDLLGIVKNSLEKTTAISDVMLSYYDPKKCFHYVYNDENIVKAGPDLILGELSPADEIFGKAINNKIIHANQPLNFYIADLIIQNKSTTFIQNLSDSGIRDFTGIAMRVNGNLLGCLYIATKSDPRFKNGDFGFLQGIADQVAVALTNVQASDEILNREKEKSILLTISNDMAAIRNKNDLLQMVQKHLKSLIYFSHAVTAVADFENQTYRGLIVDPQSRSRNYPGFIKIAHSSHPLDNSFVQKALNVKYPEIFDLDELDFSDGIPEWVYMNYKSGIKEMIIFPLFNGSELIGFFVLFSDIKKLLGEKEIRLIQGISWQLAVAVGNIIANEHVLERDHEKSVLIELSKNFAVIRNKNDLHQIINGKLKELLAISHVITLGISDDGKTFYAYSLDPNSVTIKHKAYPKVTSSTYSVKDGIIDTVLASDKPLVFDLDEVTKWSNVPKYLQMNHDVGIKEAILTALKDGEKKTGVLIILIKEKSGLNQNNLSLIQGVADQLSIAIANIKANEKIEQQLEEINQFKKQLEEENLYLQEEIQTTHNYSELIGNSTVMKKIFQLVSKVAESESSVLILGETGTGKELIARAIHNTSLRKDKVMIKVNCATLPANLIESELFGHERGSFTGATEKRIGKFELANNSTLFLDEVGELPLDLQVKLLRVLQEKEIERVGGRATIKTNVRIIAATNRDLQREVQMGSFRSDLFFRLNVFPINLPPLRDRKEDIPLLATHFLIKHSKKGMKGSMNFSGKAMRELVAYNWPGNVRELEHLLERSILLSNGRTIEHVYLPGEELEGDSLLSDGHVKTIDEVEREHIISVLKRCNGKVSGVGGAAELLKIPATTLSSKILRLKIGKGLSTEQDY